MNFDLQTVFNLALGGAMSVLCWFGVNEIKALIMSISDKLDKKADKP